MRRTAKAAEDMKAEAAIGPRLERSTDKLKEDAAASNLVLLLHGVDVSWPAVSASPQGFASSQLIFFLWLFFSCSSSCTKGFTQKRNYV